jgi:hypothetical protein
MLLCNTIQIIEGVFLKKKYIFHRQEANMLSVRIVQKEAALPKAQNFSRQPLYTAHYKFSTLQDVARSVEITPNSCF